MQKIIFSAWRKQCLLVVIYTVFTAASFHANAAGLTVTPAALDDLPITEAVPQKMTLSMSEAILLAVRKNPNVQSSQLGLISQKFSLWIQQWEFYPHYKLQASEYSGRVSVPGKPYEVSHGFNVQPSTTWKSHIGTEVDLTFSNQIKGNYTPGLSLHVKQPLLRGFGSAIVDTALNNAKDTDTITKLAMEGTLRNIVTTVINAYLDVVSAEQRIKIDEGALRRAKKSVEQTKLYVKAGHKAGNEIITVQANVASARSRLEDDRNGLLQARYALFAAIGLDPNSNVRFTNLDVGHLIAKYHLPELVTTQRYVLENDIQYQIDQITLHGQTKRSLQIAEDNTRWQLNLMADASTGHNSGSGKTTGITSLFNGVDQTQGIGLTLQIPIDDQPAKQALLNAKIALKQAELGLMKEKWTVQTNAINGWNNVMSAKRSLKFAEDAESLQEKTYNVSYQKYLHGLIDSLELQSALVSLIEAQQSLLRARIGYLKALVGLDLLIGNTLHTWDIQVRL
jgi:outer membrane protein TolC